MSIITPLRSIKYSLEESYAKALGKPEVKSDQTAREIRSGFDLDGLTVVSKKSLDKLYDLLDHVVDETESEPAMDALHLVRGMR